MMFTQTDFHTESPSNGYDGLPPDTVSSHDVLSVKPALERIA